jgi:glycosyltransferase involved in cell wall biosynthesis
VNYFYNQFDEIKVPSKGYIDILNNRGLYNPRISIFKRGIDTNKYFPIYRLSEINSINLMFAGRVSKDKNIDFLLKVFYEIRHRFRELKIKLFIVGDGPYLEKLTKEHRDKDIIFTGRVKESEMPKYYSLGDIFLFPSTTDTFGMAVLEAQACGLPAVVSDVGGPKEIIIDGVTGIVAKSGDLDEWVIKISELIEKRVSGEDIINNMKFEAVKNVKHRFEWKTVLEDLFLWR